MGIWFMSLVQRGLTWAIVERFALPGRQEMVIAKDQCKRWCNAHLKAQLSKAPLERPVT